MEIKDFGAAFSKAQNPQQLYSWYEKTLGVLPRTDTHGFSPSDQPTAIQFRVENLKALLHDLSRQGAQIESPVVETDFGSFAWVHDPEGNRIELWEPAPYQNTLINLPEPD